MYPNITGVLYVIHPISYDGSSMIGVPEEAIFLHGGAVRQQEANDIMCNLTAS